MGQITGKVIIITGASSGIGASTALYLSSKKAIVVLAARRKELLDKLAQECISVGVGH